MLRKAVFVVVALVAVVFAVANRETVTVNLWPLPFEVMLPLYLVALGAAAVGLLVGVTIAWIGKERMWLRARGAEKRAATWQREAERNTPAAARPALAPAQRTARIDDE